MVTHKEKDKKVKNKIYINIVIAFEDLEWPQYCSI